MAHVPRDFASYQICRRYPERWSVQAALLKHLLSLLKTKHISTIFSTILSRDLKHIHVVDFVCVSYLVKDVIEEKGRQRVRTKKELTARRRQWRGELKGSALVSNRGQPLASGADVSLKSK